MTGLQVGDRVRFAGDPVEGAVWTITEFFMIPPVRVARIVRKAGTPDHPGTFSIRQVVPIGQLELINKKGKQHV